MALVTSELRLPCIATRYGRMGAWFGVGLICPLAGGRSSEVNQLAS